MIKGAGSERELIVPVATQQMNGGFENKNQVS
jgi:hypothetical protein